jgi:PAS domain S-box-containing protein
MNALKSTFFQIIKRKEMSLFLVLAIASITLFGLLINNIELTSFSSIYKPISPIVTITIIVLSILLLINIYIEKSRLTKSLVALLLIIIAFFYCVNLLGFFFNFTFDIENIFVKNLNRFGLTLTGLMSPIASVLLLFICISILSIRQNNSITIKYIGGILSLFVCLISSILLLGYLYHAPLLYDSKIAPVSLPGAICFFLFSITLLRVLDFQYWTFKQISDNKFTFQLLKWFLPFTIFIVILGGVIDSTFTFNDKNPAITSVLILLFVIIITIIVVIRISSVLGGELHRKEAELIESEEKFRIITENSADSIFITNQEGKYVYTNKAVSVMLGYTNEEMMAKTIIELCPKNEIDKYNEMFMHVLSEGKVFAEIELLKKDGNYISADLNAVLLPNGLVFGSCRDITKRIQTEKVLVESEISLRNAQETAKMGSWEWDLATQNTIWSDNNYAILGFNSTEVEASFELFRSRIHHDDVHIIDENNVKLTKDKTPLNFELRMVEPDGTIKWIQNNISLVIEDDKPVKLKGVIIDITNLKKTELALKESERRLLQLNVDKDRFISILGHDLKNPFNNILALSEILTEEIESLNADEIGEIAKNINKSAKITNKLLEDILMWARTQHGKIPFKPQKLNFADICKNILEILNPNAKAKNITINYSKSDQINVLADIDMLKTVLRNLVSNAIKFTNSGGSININAKGNPENVTISVSDNGIGLTRDNIIKLFDISEIVTTTGTANETGTGLGLLLCKEFVEKNGGKIWVESEVGKGSDFMFTLPISPDLEYAKNN